MALSAEAADRRWMEQCLALSALAEGQTSPNPRVGCIILNQGRVVGRGFHRAAGGPHAEAQALAEAGAEARGADLFVNLEPCSHHGRTPPCAERIIRSEVGRVVASVTDPDPRVGGQGFSSMREAGIRVEAGLMEDEARWINRTFFHWHVTGLPWVTLKAAVSLDGMLAAREGRSRWITGPVARRFAHRMRLRHDAILVGAGTVRRDNPRLTVRLPGVRAHRLRAVLSPALNLDPAARVFDEKAGGKRTRIYSSGAGREETERFRGRAEVCRVRADEGRLDLREVLSDLGAEGVQSVLVEGGGKTLASFLEAGLVQEAALFLSPLILGGRGGVPMIDLDSVAEPAAGWALSRIRRIALGEDLLVMGCVGKAGDPAEGGACSRGS